MLAAKAAQIFHDWALLEGLMSESPIAPATTDGERALIAPVFDEGKAILRHKRILSVGYNEAAKEIVAYTRLAAPSGKKSKSAMPSRVDDIKIVYHQGSHSVAGDTPAVPFGGPPYVIRQVGNRPRLSCGSSISVGNCVDAGTLGALVRRADGTMFGLSNNHVSASCSHAESGLPIVAPGLADVTAHGMHPFTLGLHESALPMVLGSPTVVSIADNSDAALFKIVDDQVVSSYQGDAYDTPSLTTPLLPGMTVEKIGRTTGHTTGYVESQEFGPTVVSYAASRYQFTGQIYFNNVYVITGVGGAFSGPGDSGSLITTVVDGTRYATGLLFAGRNSGQAPGGTITLALPIEPILAALNVSLVSGHYI